MRTITVQECGLFSFRGLFNRPITGPDDYGDDETIGACLKSSDPSADLQFATYLGKREVGYMVQIVDLDNNSLGGEVFDTIEEMQQRWIVD